MKELRALTVASGVASGDFTDRKKMSRCIRAV